MKVNNNPSTIIDIPPKETTPLNKLKKESWSDICRRCTKIFGCATCWSVVCFFVGGGIISGVSQGDFDPIIGCLAAAALGFVCTIFICLEKEHEICCSSRDTVVVENQCRICDPCCGTPDS